MTFDFAFIVRFFLVALAVYRLAWMLAREDGPFNIFERVRCWLGKRAGAGKGLGWTIAELFNCVHCLGFWLAFLCAPTIIRPSAVTDIILLVLAIAGLQSYLARQNEDE